jgi:hypothetical protein
VGGQGVGRAGWKKDTSVPWSADFPSALWGQCPEMGTFVELPSVPGLYYWGMR